MYFVSAIDATSIFKVNAAGFISNGATLNNAITARYPEARRALPMNINSNIYYVQIKLKQQLKETIIKHCITLLTVNLNIKRNNDPILISFIRHGHVF